MRAFLTLILFFMAVPVARGNFQPTQDADFWKGTGVDAGYLKQFVSNKICRENEALFKSCLSALTQADWVLKQKTFVPQIRTSFSNADKVDFDAAVEHIEKSVKAFTRFPSEMVYASIINDQLRTFDSHASLAPVDLLSLRYSGATQEVSSIGIEEEISASGVYVRRVYPGTPAAAANLMPNDRIVSLNGKTVPGGVKAISVMRELAQAPGKTVEMTIERDGEIYATTVVIARLSLRNVSVDYIPFGARVLAVVTLRQFSEGVCEDLARQLSVPGLKLDGLLLDLRGNRGGQVAEAACLKSLFITKGELVEKRSLETPIPKQFPLTMDFSAEDQQSWRYGLRDKAMFPDLPLVILVNAVSASASEMLAAALQDQKRAWVVGEVTFGKGSTQAVVAVNGKAELRLIYTVSRYYRPEGGLPLQLIGMTPNFVVPFNHKATAAQRTFPREAELWGTLLEREPSQKWQETRKAEVALRRQCVEKQGLVQWFSKWHQGKYDFEDYQKSYAFALVYCGLSGPTKDLKPRQ
ncbi:MAG: PDZ domain-containing protein [Bdellovibrionales bacterium]|nr:PDZ domain-containing protein [Bdellovibrionales bacterium]